MGGGGVPITPGGRGWFGGSEYNLIQPLCIDPDAPLFEQAFGYVAEGGVAELAAPRGLGGLEPDRLLGPGAIVSVESEKGFKGQLFVFVLIRRLVRTLGVEGGETIDREKVLRQSC